eukprot:TRINITY_DN4923_c0_g1_i1.p1 TRINITY_DN4923_c0_g1~~TRINITY_DN4923_c0_g1_i1.p1  ORF type:complete len:103 (-),score=33.64 TRINITY_DN4923_c0_g1_i1:46-354(-)
MPCGNIKKFALRLADRIGSLFLSTIASKANEIAEDAKHKMIEVDDMVKALNKCGFGDYAEIFKDAANDNGEESDEEPEKKRRDKDDGKATGKNKKGKKKDCD